MNSLASLSYCGSAIRHPCYSGKQAKALGSFIFNFLLISTNNNFYFLYSFVWIFFEFDGISLLHVLVTDCIEKFAQELC